MTSEKAIHDRLLAVQSHLLSLRSTTGGQATADLTKRWTEVETLVKQLSSLRSEQEQHTEDDGTADPELSQRVDALIEDVVPMFVNFWSQSGKVSQEMYPVYVQLAKISHQLDHLNETGLYTDAILATYKSKIRRLASQVASFTVHGKEDEGRKQYEQGLALLQSKQKECEQKLATLVSSIQSIDSALHPIYNRLVEIKTELEAILSRRNPHAFSLAEVQMLQDELRTIDSARIDGRYISKGGETVAGQGAVIGLMEACYDDVHELLAARDPIGGDNVLRPLYEKLITIKAKLERLAVAHRWMKSRSELLIGLQKELGEIDNLRVDGKFLDEQGNVPEGQAVLHFLLHKCYRLVYKINANAEPVDDSLMPIYNQLVTLKKCLAELVRWHVRLTQHELVPYKLRLGAFDNMRVNNIFLNSDGEIPMGQGVLHILIDECYDLIEKLSDNVIEQE
ncbi:hypothetical protein HK097_006794 [Rhizophlyctis rosea]|uniref:Uncharacterized protein n=1 Tax=Rhizophlyctis rosea TaxID=64517 RepID=A0AAD5X5Y3_9FUNG|nr:hypothetical protein HK097_006794 [Rhizophlyctis rosea]